MGLAADARLQVEVDMEYHKTMLGLHLKANPREVLVGWQVFPMQMLQEQSADEAEQVRYFARTQHLLRLDPELLRL